MGRKRLIHDTAWAASFNALDAVRCVLDPEDQKHAQELFYQIIKAAIENLDIMQAREDHRLIRKTSNN
jgi:hypothetical protein